MSLSLLLLLMSLLLLSCCSRCCYCHCYYCFCSCFASFRCCCCCCFASCCFCCFACCCCYSACCCCCCCCGCCYCCFRNPGRRALVIGIWSRSGKIEGDRGKGGDRGGEVWQWVLGGVGGGGWVGQGVRGGWEGGDQKEWEWKMIEERTESPWNDAWGPPPAMT